MSHSKPAPKKSRERKQTHILRGPDRTITLEITENQSYLMFALRMSRYGWSGSEERLSFDEWLVPILAPYINDPRPMVVPDPETGEIAVIGGNGSNITTLIYTPSPW